MAVKSGQSLPTGYNSKKILKRVGAIV